MERQEIELFPSPIYRELKQKKKKKFAIEMVLEMIFELVFTGVSLCIYFFTYFFTYLKINYDVMTLINFSVKSCNLQ